MSRTDSSRRADSQEVGDILGARGSRPRHRVPHPHASASVTDDLPQARIYYTTLGEPADRKKTARGARARAAVHPASAWPSGCTCAVCRSWPSSSTSRSPTRRGSRNCSRRSSARTRAAHADGFRRRNDARRMSRTTSRERSHQRCRRDPGAAAVRPELARAARRRRHRIAARDGLRARCARQGRRPGQPRSGAGAAARRSQAPTGSSSPIAPTRRSTPRSSWSAARSIARA